MGEHGRVMFLIDDHVGLPLPLTVDNILFVLLSRSGTHLLRLRNLFHNSYDLPI